MSIETSKVLYAFPTGGHPVPDFVTNYAAHARAMPGCELMHVPGLLPMSRDAICMRALRGDFDWLVMHDDDLVVEGPALSSMFKTMEERPDVAAIGAVYLKSGPILPAVMKYHPKLADWGKDYAPEICPVVKRLPSEPFEVAVAPTGFMVVRVQALRTLAEQGTPIVRQDTIRHRWGSLNNCTDDTDLCLRLGKAGWKILADPRHVTVHWKKVGPLVYDHAKWEAQEFIDVRPLREKECHFVSIDGVECLDFTPEGWR